MEGRFIGRDIVEKPACPFCGIFIEPPREQIELTTHEMPVGKCSCGAAYAFDVTGHNLGSAMIDALLFCCNGDWKLSWDLVPEDDYLEKEIKNYDLETHLIVHGGVYEGRRIAGVLYFIRLKNEMIKISKNQPIKGVKNQAPIPRRPAPKPRKKLNFTKKEIERLVDQYDMDRLLSIAAQDHRIIRSLQRLLYSGDRVVRSKAADTMGKVSLKISENHPEVIVKFIQGLFTSLGDSAASSWGYIDAVGEIIANSPDLYGHFLPQIFQFVKDKSLLPEVLRALGKTAKTKPNLLRASIPQFVPFLQDDDPEVRGYTIILMGNLNAGKIREEITKCLKDTSEIEIYESGKITQKTIGILAEEAIKNLS